MIKKLALVFVLGVSAMACSKPHHVETAKAPEPVAEPAPAPEPVKVGEQLTLPEQIEFEFNEARIMQTPKTLAALEKLADIMKKSPHITKLRVEGHTDNVGKARRNEKLSKARAEAVAKWLAQHEVDEKRITTVGYGATRPLAPNDSADHRAQNRRTEYYVDEVDGKRVEDQKEQKVTAAGTASGGKTAN